MGKIRSKRGTEESQAAPVGDGGQAGLGAGRLEIPGAQQAQRLGAPHVRIRGRDVLYDLLFSQPVYIDIR